MAASSHKRMKDLLTDEDIYRVLGIEDESDVFSEESDDFCFDTSEEDSEGNSDTSSIVHESEPYEEVSHFTQPCVPHSMACPRFAFLSVSGMNVDFGDEIKQPCVPHSMACPRFAFLSVSSVNVDFGDEIRVLECFQKFIDEDMWQLFAEQTNIYTNQFLAAMNDPRKLVTQKMWVRAWI